MNWTADTSHPPISRVGSGGSGGSGAEGMFRHGTGNAQFHGHEQVLSPFDEPKTMALYPTWTQITSDFNLVQHLLALYFCWEYPTFASLSDHFFKECQRLFYQEADHHSLTTIQALGIMAIREASCGRDSESWYLAGQSIRLAVEMGLHRTDGVHDEDELAVQSATFWGAFALDQ
ncbi:Nitrogen assimilation transcription factor nit-4 [Escovopsis weberi]|uniref:Nitrogen assimilation transcription factor nit-4 n=1 Tax=Escovopsis weberi TaxID=150374 RepID=A0A0M8N2S3_ESCWE|nr:Nitrogen assimilation transcription factor nit-4 [Escovopsis weberi]